MDTPIAPAEFQHWKDTALLDGDTIGRFAVTIDRLQDVNTQLLEALERLLKRALDLREGAWEEYGGIPDDLAEPTEFPEARAAIQAAKETA